MNEYIKLDYTLKTPEERTNFIRNLIKENKITYTQAERYSNYILAAIPKKERMEKRILTDNRLKTVDKRETSFDGLASKLESGEDGIYSMLSDLGKSGYLDPKIAITEEDLEEIPELRELRKTIENLEKELNNAAPGSKHSIKEQIIALRRLQYTLKIAYRKPITAKFCVKNILDVPRLEGKITIDEEGNIHDESIISFFNTKHITYLLKFYSELKQSYYSDFHSDIYYLMQDFDNLVDKALKNYPLLYDLLVYKIDGLSNEKIKAEIEKNHAVTYKADYYSVLWRQKIPKLIAQQATKDYLEWYFTFVEYGSWKRCSRCGEVKLAHNLFFSKNRTSRDGFYSICKCCRSQKAAITMRSKMK